MSNMSTVPTTPPPTPTRTPTAPIIKRVKYERPLVKCLKELQSATPDKRHQFATEVFKFLKNPDHRSEWDSVFNKRDTKMIDDMLNDKDKYYIDDDFINYIRLACIRRNTFSMTRIKYFLFANK